MTAPARVLVVGWDGASWDALDPLLGAGRLPHLQALIARGWRTALRSTVPAVTPAAWTAMATGCDPGTTGVLGFRHLDLARPGGYSPVLAGSADLRGRTLFEYAAQQGVGVASLAWPMTWPPFALQDGVLLSGWPRPETREAPVAPAALAAELGPWATTARPSDPELTDAGQRDPVAAATERDGRTHRAALHVLATRRDQLITVVYQGTDHLAHRFWGQPELDRYLVRVDAWLGELIDAAGPSTGVLLVSDHGFGPAPTTTVHLGRALEQAALLTVRPGRSRGGVARAARDRVSTRSRKALRDRLPGALRRWAWERAQGLDRVDRSATAVVRVPLYGPWEGLVVQVRGRQRGGVVAPEDWDGVRARAIAALCAIEDENGALVVRCQRREEVWTGPRVADLPDLVVELRADCVGGAGLGPGPLCTPRRVAPGEGSHRRQGVAVGGGPGFASRALPPDLEPIDVLPTALGPLGIPTPLRVQGRPRADLLADSDLGGGARGRPRRDRAVAPGAGLPLLTLLTLLTLLVPGRQARHDGRDLP